MKHQVYLLSDVKSHLRFKAASQCVYVGDWNNTSYYVLVTPNNYQNQ